MALHSEQYRYHGLSKSGLRKILEEMFSDCDNLPAPTRFHPFLLENWPSSPPQIFPVPAACEGLSKETGKRVFVTVGFTKFTL
jgi:hypothetical protein